MKRIEEIDALSGNRWRSRPLEFSICNLFAKLVS